MLGVGIDIEEISRFKKYSIEKDGHFLKSIFSKNELEYCFQKKHPEKHLAARFCAKEAFFKALPYNDKRIKFNEIEILNDEEDKPYIQCAYFTNFKFLVSLSHDKTKAIAIVNCLDNN